METETKYNVYGNESSPKITYKYVDGYWQKQYKIYDYLGSLRYTISQMNKVLNYKAYDPYGNEIIDTLKQTRQGYIGKENDVENGLGDFGVRKYDGGRFNSPDPMWEEYYGWSPYNYCQNNPITNSDPSGDQFFTLGIDPIWMSTFNDAAVAPKPLWWGFSVNIPAPALPPGPIIIDLNPSKSLTPQDATNLSYPKPLEASKTESNNGPATPSKTVWTSKDNKGRLDVENPNPGKRPGQIHYQEKGKDIKYYYDPVKKTFKDMPKSLEKQLMKDSKFIKGIEKGMKYLGN